MMNMMIAEGFRAAGVGALAARIKADTAVLVSHAGFHEYFDPQTGAGLGGGHFSWTASVALSWPLLDGVSMAQGVNS
jgi:alpha,alpha-trehalase